MAATKFTPAVQRKICESLKRGHYAVAAAALAGIDERTYYKWLERGEAGEEPYGQFGAAVARAKAEAEDVALGVIGHAAWVAKDWKAAAWWLEKARPYTWGPREKPAGKATPDDYEIDLSPAEPAGAPEAEEPGPGPEA